MFDGLRFQHWQPELRADGLVVLTLDRADQGVNALCRAVLDELELAVERLVGPGDPRRARSVRR